jgi:hypothetical protein
MQSADILLRYKSFHWLARKATSTNPSGRRTFFNPAIMDVCRWSGCWIAGVRLDFSSVDSISIGGCIRG